MTETLAERPAAHANEHPLVQRLVNDFQAAWITPESLPAFAQATSGEQVLLFTGDPVRFPECLDVAVVLPELQRAFEPSKGRIAIGVVCREVEDEVARRYGVQRWPSMVFLRGGQYVATIAGMLDWTDYLARMAEVQATPASRPPIPLVSPHAADSHCH
jgi:hydrogenase-1 operon protein HyaE